MKHFKRVTVQAAMEKQDSAGLIFFQIWASVFTAILSKAFVD